MIASVVLTTALTACSGSSSDPAPTSSPAAGQSTPEPPSTSTTSPPPPVSPSRSPEEAAAVTAYLNFVQATNMADRNPRSAKLSSLSKYAIDPALGQAANDVDTFQMYKLQFRGIPPRSRIALGKVDLGAKPHPSVILFDCPTVSSSWAIYYIDSGKPATPVHRKVPPPYRTEAKIVRIAQVWVVETTSTDTDRTCGQ